MMAIDKKRSISLKLFWGWTFGAPLLIVELLQMICLYYGLKSGVIVDSISIRIIGDLSGQLGLFIYISLFPLLMYPGCGGIESKSIIMRSIVGAFVGVLAFHVMRTIFYAAKYKLFVLPGGSWLYIHAFMYIALFLYIVLILIVVRWRLGKAT